jgi:hypothetical protein
VNARETADCDTPARAATSKEVTRVRMRLIIALRESVAC